MFFWCLLNLSIAWAGYDLTSSIKNILLEPDLFWIYCILYDLFLIVWGGILNYRPSFLLEKEKLTARCSAWFGITIMSALILVYGVVVHQFIFLKPIYTFIFGIVMFFCYRHSSFFRPYKIALPALPLYYHYQA